ncbi:MAG TPA: alpha/beta fold hydrolase [Actinophytocola sp.]|uniref:thioesterase II family protein n=1 Tax=Actinophytocola sp. TaxID=1872138 RepID=UPI002DBF5540|nr:alpha/beta fold hydrolase [Actinophytocola sp.]HEU5470220.1 alpha/beta fold hydrolase [Actinophytocola sp.]
MTGSWFRTGNRPAHPRAHVFCFPHGGGDPRGYLGWQAGLDAELLAVCAPGRGHRFAEPPPESIGELAVGAADAIAGHADAPIVLFGHSFGALVAFEVARLLRDTATPRHVVLSGCVAPALLPTEYLVWAAGLDGREFAEAAGRYEGLAPEIVADEELQELLLPGLRADLRLIAGYRYRPAAPLAIGATLVNGRDDWHVAENLLEPWRAEFTTPPAQHWHDGGHFYFDEYPTAVPRLLATLVSELDESLDQHVEVI